jgi:protein-histidine N-methyltransferase
MFSFNFYNDPVQEKDVKTDVEETEIKSIPLEDILAQLPDTLAYSILGGLPRRELWHVKMQIMQNDKEEYLLGDSDVVKGSYEGGLKTWECSVDLAEYLSRQNFPDELSFLEVCVSIVGRVNEKLGCGSALPTALLFSRALRDGKRWKFVLQDYNDIFSLVTVPNLFLTWYVSEYEASDEIIVYQELKEQFMKKISALGIQFEFIVGAWGDSLIVRVVSLCLLTRRIIYRHTI